MSHTPPISDRVPTPSAHKERSRSARIRALVPGLSLAIGAAGVSYGLSLVVPVMSPLIIAIVLGILIANVVSLPSSTAKGIDFSAKKLLRVGIVFLGLRLVLSDIADLGAPMLIVILCIVAGGILGTILLGRLLRVPQGLTLLIACGFSICGAAAVAGAAGVTDPDDENEEDTVTAVALVVIFGTLMIPLIPFLADLIGLDTETAGMWAGGSVHEIAQVVAIGGIIGTGAMTVAVVVKLARVLLLAPVVAVLSIRQRRQSLAPHGTAPQSGSGAQDAGKRGAAKLPPLIPPFILGFLGMVLLRSFVNVPESLLTAGEVLQTGLLAAAMFGLGCGVKIRNLYRVGLRPFVLAALATVLVASIAYAGITLVH
ncbi:YeiH family protein [Actinomycetaceae bacterium L2_0104]